MKKQIEAHIRKLYLRRLWRPILWGGIALALLFSLSFREIAAPRSLSLSQLTAEPASKYVSITIPELSDTGFDYMENGRKYGSYYYAIYEDVCYLVLVKVQDQNLFGLPSGQPLTLSAKLTDYSFTGKLRRDPQTQAQLLNYFSEELSWSYDKISAMTYPLLLDECHYKPEIALWAQRLLILMLLINALRLGISLMVIAAPQLSRQIRFLIRYGSIRQQLAEANRELEQGLLLDDPVFKLTDHYFIQFGKKRMLIMPRKRLVWAYKIGSSSHPLSLRAQVRYHLYMLGHCMYRLETEAASNEMATEILQLLKIGQPSLLTAYTDENRNKAFARARGKKSAKKSGGAE